MRFTDRLRVGNLLLLIQTAIDSIGVAAILYRRSLP
jgi:hypothetical protein